MDEVAEKTCPRCGTTKPVAEFYKNKRTKDGLQAYCKPCQNAARARSRKAHPGEHQRYYAKNKERVLARQAEARAADLEGYRARKAEWMRNARAADPEKFREMRRAWRAAGKETRDPEKDAARLAAWKAKQQAEDPDGYRERKNAATRAWAKRHPERAAEKVRRRRAMQLGVTVEPVDVDALWTGTCGICGNGLARSLSWPNPLSKSLDHIVPLILGGAHSQDNLQWTHLGCNLAKGATLPD